MQILHFLQYRTISLQYFASKEKPFVLGLPMGDTPKGMYKKLIELNHKGKLSFANIVIFCMNEFVGIDAKAPQSCHSYMNEFLLKKLTYTLILILKN